MAFDFKKFIFDARLNTKVGLSEMARVAAVAFKLAPDYESKLDTVKIGSAHKAMIDFLKSKNNEAHTIGDISRAISKDSASINQPYFRQNLVNVIFEPVPIGPATTKPKVEDENDVFVEPQDVKQGKTLDKIIDPEDMVLGGEIEDDLESGVLSFGPDNDEEEEPSGEKIDKREPTQISPAKRRASDFAMDNERLIKSIINNYSASKLKVKEAKDKGEEIGGLSNKDIKTADKKSREAATAKLPDLIAKLVEKIKAEEPDVQEAILSNMSYELGSIGYTNLYKRIAKDVGVKPKEEPKPAEPDDNENEDELAEAIKEIIKQMKA